MDRIMDNGGGPQQDEVLETTERSPQVGVRSNSSEKVSMNPVVIVASQNLQCQPITGLPQVTTASNKHSQSLAENDQDEKFRNPDNAEATGEPPRKKRRSNRAKPPLADEATPVDDSHAAIALYLAHVATLGALDNLPKGMGLLYQECPTDLPEPASVVDADGHLVYGCTEVLTERRQGHTIKDYMLHPLRDLRNDQGRKILPDSIPKAGLEGWHMNLFLCESKGKLEVKDIITRMYVEISDVKMAKEQRRISNLGNRWRIRKGGLPYTRSRDTKALPSKAELEVIARTTSEQHERNVCWSVCIDEEYELAINPDSNMQNMFQLPEPGIPARVQVLVEQLAAVKREAEQEKVPWQNAKRFGRKKGDRHEKRENTLWTDDEDTAVDVESDGAQ
ncbi:hypothetical protein LTR16_000798 [Cryomyces antarcticus]|uniref:Uncharacterized protein n=1 Tax=Cryomyces antarcticus TaxID=329879 RepID=A0ABR0KWA4_9PEZI|nr:hypothetical protein LTR60_000926 [Cryomyces antarcticus]KAK5131397.1 hypothetical protein LTR16_000798 [Cryomyces antarcticus]